MQAVYPDHAGDRLQLLQNAKLAFNPGGRLAARILIAKRLDDDCLGVVLAYCMPYMMLRRTVQQVAESVAGNLWRARRQGRELKAERVREALTIGVAGDIAQRAAVAA